MYGNHWNVILFNHQPGGCLWLTKFWPFREFTEYVLEDENHNEFSFTSESRLGAYTYTGLSGKVRLWKDRFLEQDFFPLSLCQVTGLVYPDNGETEWQKELKINIRRGADNRVVFDPEFRRGIFKMPKGQNYIVEDGRQRFYKFSGGQLYSLEQIRGMNKLRGRIRISLNGTIIFNEL